MVQTIKINNIDSELDDSLVKYIYKKIGRLDKYLSRQLRSKLSIEVFLKESKTKNKNNCLFEANLVLPNEKITAKESTLNMYASIDVVEEKLKHQIIKYNQKNHSPKIYHHLLRRLTRKSKNHETFS